MTRNMKDSALKNIAGEFAIKTANTLHELVENALEDVAATFLDEIIERVLTMPPRDLAALVPGNAPRRVRARRPPAGGGAARKGGRLHRRSADEIQAGLDAVVRLVRKSKDGLRAEDIRTELGLDRRELPRVLKEGVAVGALKVVSGQKRSTAYGAGSGRRSASKSARKAAKHAKAKTARAKPAQKAAKPAQKAAKPAQKAAKRAKHAKHAKPVRRAKEAKRAAPRKAAPKKDVAKPVVNGAASTATTAS